LTQYEGEIIATQWKVISISVFTTIVTCLLLVWLLIPKPTFPFKQIKYLNSGMMMELFWPKLSKKEQHGWNWQIKLSILVSMKLGVITNLT
jgi:hypothetical protein